MPRPARSLVKYWTAHFIGGGPLHGKTELCRGPIVEPLLKTPVRRKGEAFQLVAGPLDELPTEPPVNAFLIHEYREAWRETSGPENEFLHVYYRWAGEPKIPQVEGVL